MITVLLVIVAFALGAVVGRLRVNKAFLEIQEYLFNIDRNISFIKVSTNKDIKRYDESLVYYGPHACQKCDFGGQHGTLIVKAGNGAPDNLEFDFPEEEAKKLDIPYHMLYPNAHFGINLTWKRHKHIKVKKTKTNKKNGRKRR